MDEPLTKLQDATISHAVKKLYKTEKIVSHDLDFSKWKIKKLYKDTLWVKMLDEPVADTIQLSSGLTVPVNQAKGMYKLGQVLMAGTDVKHAHVGEYIRFPHGIGTSFDQNVDGFKTILIREDHVMMVVEFEGDEADIVKNIEETILHP
jgi:hypothetical protein